MPEIAEVARIVHFLRLHLVGRRIANVSAPDDPVLFGKAGTSGPEFEAAVNGKKVVSAGSQGKYFWLTFDKPPHIVMHFGMTGWIHIRGEQTAYTNYYNKMKDDEKTNWPPKFCKFSLETDEDPKVEVAYTDPRRFGRVRVVDCPGSEIRNHSPLVENGPDPVVDANIFTEDFFRDKIQSRRVPIKALLLNQTVISGIGNWVADEVLYQSRLHPEQYCNEFSEAEISRLYKSIRFVCQLAVDKLGDSDQFPDDWLFSYRWGKGDRDAKTTLPNGQKLAFLTVGGRTSCYAPGLQKKTGKVLASAVEEPVTKEKGSKRKRPTSGGEKAECRNKSQSPYFEAAGDADEEKVKVEDAKEQQPDTPKKKRASQKVSRAVKKEQVEENEETNSTVRRSSRLRK